MYMYKSVAWRQVTYFFYYLRKSGTMFQKVLRDIKRFTCEQRFLSPIAFGIYEVVHVTCQYNDQYNEVIIIILNYPLPLSGFSGIMKQLFK